MKIVNYVICVVNLFHANCLIFFGVYKNIVFTFFHNFNAVLIFIWIIIASIFYPQNGKHLHTCQRSRLIKAITNF